MRKMCLGITILLGLYSTFALSQKNQVGNGRILVYASDDTYLLSEIISILDSMKISETDSSLFSEVICFNNILDNRAYEDKLRAAYNSFWSKKFVTSTTSDTIDQFHAERLISHQWYLEIQVKPHNSLIEYQFSLYRTLNPDSANGSTGMFPRNLISNERTHSFFLNPFSKTYKRDLIRGIKTLFPRCNKGPKSIVRFEGKAIDTIRIAVGDTFMVDGYLSNDPDSFDTLTFRWRTLTKNPRGKNIRTLSPVLDQQEIAVCVLEPGVYDLRLEVTDGLVMAENTVTILCYPKPRVLVMHNYYPDVFTMPARYIFSPKAIKQVDKLKWASFLPTATMTTDVIIVNVVDSVFELEIEPDFELNPNFPGEHCVPNGETLDSICKVLQCDTSSYYYAESVADSFIRYKCTMQEFDRRYSLFYDTNWTKPVLPWEELVEVPNSPEVRGVRSYQEAEGYEAMISMDLAVYYITKQVSIDTIIRYKSGVTGITFTGNQTTGQWDYNLVAANDGIESDRGAESSIQIVNRIYRPISFSVRYAAVGLDVDSLVDESKLPLSSGTYGFISLEADIQLGFTTSLAYERSFFRKTRLNKFSFGWQFDFMKAHLVYGVLNDGIGGKHYVSMYGIKFGGLSRAYMNNFFFQLDAGYYLYGDGALFEFCLGIRFKRYYPELTDHELLKSGI